MSGKIVFPRYFDKDAKSLVKRLLTADLSNNNHNLHFTRLSSIYSAKRYGELRNGVDDIKGCDWFIGINNNNNTIFNIIII